MITYWYNSENSTTKKTLTGLNSFTDDAFKIDFKLPLAGNRNYSPVAPLNSQGSLGYYWSSSPYGVDNPALARTLSLSSSYVSATSYDGRSYGYSLRCFKDSPNAPETLIYTFNQNGGNLLGAEE